LGPERLIGVSCHSLAEVRESEDGGANFVVLGPIFQTPSKAAYGPPLTTAALREARAGTGLPVLAIGGIRESLVGEVMAAGADGVAVISAVMAAHDSGQAAATLLAAVAAARRGN
jgi:thiamine-phosphate pyrophosphorylase